MRLDRMLAALEGVENIKPVVGQLGARAWEMFCAGLMLLEVATQLRQAAIPVRFVHDAGAVSADLVAKPDARWVTVECTALQMPKAETEAGDFCDRLEQWLREQGVLDQGCLLVFLKDVTAREAEARLPELQQSILDLVASGQRTRLVDGLAALQFSPGERPAFRAVQSGPVIERYSDVTEKIDFRRLLGRIREKSAQLSEGTPSLLVIRTRELFAFSRNVAADMAVVHERLADWLRGTPSIGAVVIHEQSLAGGEPDVRSLPIGGGAILGTDAEARHRAAFVVRNPGAEFPLSELEASSLLAAVGG